MTLDSFTVPLTVRPAVATVFARARCSSGLCFGLRVLGREPVAFELGKGAKGEVAVRYDLAVQVRPNGAVAVIYTESILSGATSILRHGFIELGAVAGSGLKFEFYCSEPGARLQFEAIS